MHARWISNKFKILINQLFQCESVADVQSHFTSNDKSTFQYTFSTIYTQTAEVAEAALAT